jgi:hypothetical protein
LSDLPAGLFDQDPPHGFGGCGKEVSAAVPVLRLFAVQQAQVGFVDEGRGLQRLAGILLRHADCGEVPQLVVNERQELFRGSPIPLFQPFQNPRDLAHTVPPLAPFHRTPRGRPLRGFASAGPGYGCIL